MKFGGSFNKNWANASGSGNQDFQRDVLLDEIARVIELDRPKIISLLKESGYAISPKASKKEVIDKTVSALFRSNQFKADVTKLIVQTNIPKYSNADGEFLDKIKGFFNKDKGGRIDEMPRGSASGAGAGASGTVGAIASAIGSIFNFATTSKQQKIQEQQAKQELYNKLLTENDNKTNWTPIIIVGSVLVIGTIVVFFAMRNK